MTSKGSFNKFLISILIIGFILPGNILAQKTTRVEGIVTDAQTGEPLPFVSVAFVGKNIGETTDFDGSYSIETQWASGKIEFSYLGYVAVVKDVHIGENQQIDVQLEPSSVILKDVEVVATRKRYRNKGNPAVDLIKKVIANKDRNRLSSLDHCEFDQYKKIQFDLNNITEDFTGSKVFRDFQFMFEHIDTSKVNGKPYLPIFLEETVSKVYKRKSPRANREVIKGSKMVGLDNYLDTEGVDIMVDNMYQEVDLYDNNVIFLTNQFVSPLSTTSPLVYKFHIMDTLDYNGVSVINLAFQPRNKQDFAFTGNILITNDDRYALVKAEMKIADGINLNFVEDLKLVQEFEPYEEGYWLISRDELIVDFNVTKKGLGMFGRKTIFYDQYQLNKARPDSLFNGIDIEVKQDGFDNRDSTFWNESRLVELTAQEKNIYSMVDSVQQVPSFTRAMDVLLFFLEGYIDVGPIEIGPFNSFYSFNAVEGSRFRFGGRTSEQLSKRFRLEGYFTYGFKDRRFKYSGSAIWSLNGGPVVSKIRHTLSATYQQETRFPGMDLELLSDDNFILSFTRGAPDQLLYYNKFNLEHLRDWGSGVTTTVSFETLEQSPGGSLAFEGEGFTVDKITSSEVSASIRFAPNEQFYQGPNYRTPMNTKYPVFKLAYTQGMKGVLDSDYTYSKLRFTVFKRFAISPIGNTYAELEAGKVFGENIPFPLLFVPRANQTYAHQLRSYSMMNFLEFISDEYVSFVAEHHFYGFFLNKVPLLRKLKFREVVTFKGLYGGLSDKNNPQFSTGLLNLPTDDEGNPTTFSLEDKPYMEVSFGLENIFKVFRVDLVQRLTYLDHPDVSSLGVRVKLNVEF
ncbi:MAG: carboxypeptidase-like regulatory domain-containing protein [Bacteroidetes bacterium]|nr:MAG: carboxypeptidase-like regulatory domain-containing protein [Bacteroidota bacterium]